jgi:hypothetical protein
MYVHFESIVSVGGAHGINNPSHSGRLQASRVGSDRNGHPGANFGTSSRRSQLECNSRVVAWQLLNPLRQAS